ncbi:M23 family peptidase [Xanthomonas maliensis]|nr:M23 family peptidase [Xanthomonas maliensis]
MPILALVLSATALRSGHADAQRWHWADIAAAERPAHAPHAAPVTPLQVQWQPPAYLVWVTNPLAGPAQVQVSAAASADYSAVPALPVTHVLPAGERLLLARLYPSSSRRTLDALDVRLTVVPGDPQARPQPALYQLPFSGIPVRVDQGFGGAFSHHDAANFYAVDFALPRGTPILAARAGVVMEVQRDFTEDNGHGEATGGGNLVRILHADGSMAIYAHLDTVGIAVRPGQAVRLGERLGNSGNTGFSTAPHLHFAVQRNAGLQLRALPFRMQGPQGELQFPVSLP